MNAHRSSGINARWGAMVVAAWFVFLAPLAILIASAVAGLAGQSTFLFNTRRGWTLVAREASDIILALMTSVSYSAATVVGAFAVTVLPAFALSRSRGRGSSILEALFMSPIVIPPITYAMGLHLVMIYAGLADRLIGVVIVLIGASYPYMLRALITAFQMVPEDYDGAARNLGAGLARRLLRVHVPMILPGIATGGLVVFLVAFSDYLLVYMIGGGRVSSFVTYLFPFLSAGDYGVGAVLVLLFVAAPLMLALAVDRMVRNAYRKWGILR